MEYNDFNKITTDTVGSKFEEFWTQYLDPKFAANKIAKIALQFRVGFANGSVRSFSAIDIVCADDKLKMQKFYMNIHKWYICEYYSLNHIDTIILGYRILKDDTPTSYPSGIEHLEQKKKNSVFPQAKRALSAEKIRDIWYNCDCS